MKALGGIRLTVPRASAIRQNQSRSVLRGIGHIIRFACDQAQNQPQQNEPNGECTGECKGKSNSVVHGTSRKTHCDFDYSGSMMEQMLLGLVAHRVGKKIDYDPATGRVTNSSEANEYLRREYRSGWKLDG